MNRFIAAAPSPDLATSAVAQNVLGSSGQSGSDNSTTNAQMPPASMRPMMNSG